MEIAIVGAGKYGRHTTDYLGKLCVERVSTMQLDIKASQCDPSPKKARKASGIDFSNPGLSIKKTYVTTKTPHVLLVEDNIIALLLIETLVTQAGLKFTSAIDGESALILAKSINFDFIITDIGLPGISGYELTYAIRQWEKDTNKDPVPIIGITAHALSEVKNECLQSGMQNMLSKPIDLKTIQELIKQLHLFDL